MPRTKDAQDKASALGVSMSVIGLSILMAVVLGLILAVRNPQRVDKTIGTFFGSITPSHQETVRGKAE